MPVLILDEGIALFELMKGGMVSICHKWSVDMNDLRLG